MVVIILYSVDISFFYKLLTLIKKLSTCSRYYQAKYVWYQYNVANCISNNNIWIIWIFVNNNFLLLNIVFFEY
jgi:hypothetical protein